MKTPDENEAPAKKPSMILTVALLAGLTAVAGGGGWFFGGIVAPQEEPAAAAAHADEAEGEGETEEQVRIVDLDPITTNLAYPSENWVRLEIALLFADLPDTALAQTIHQDILAYLRTVSLQQIEGPRGFQHLREDLVERVALRSEGKVPDLMFRTFVIE